MNKSAKPTTAAPKRVTYASTGPVLQRKREATPRYSVRVDTAVYIEGLPKHKYFFATYLGADLYLCRRIKKKAYAFERWVSGNLYTPSEVHFIYDRSTIERIVRVMIAEPDAHVIHVVWKKGHASN